MTNIYQKFAVAAVGNALSLTGIGGATKDEEVDMLFGILFGVSFWLEIDDFGVRWMIGGEEEEEVPASVLEEEFLHSRTKGLASFPKADTVASQAL